jgi:Domain of unknown function (DUF4270)
MQFKDTLRKLILLSITAFAVFSCITVDKSLGDQYIPDDQKLKVMVAEFRLPVSLKMEDSLQGISGNNGYGTFGAIRTKEFGLATFGVAANICQPYTTFRFGKDPVIKSIYFMAAVSNKYLIDANQAGIPQNVFIYRTTKKIDSTSIYNNSITDKDYNPVPLNVSSVTYFGGDSVKVYLNNALGTELLSATETELDSIDLFTNRFKGLYIQCTPPEGDLIGGRLNNMSYSSAVISIKYNFQPTWEAGLSRKDTTVLFSFGDGFCVNTSSYSSAHLATAEPLTEEIPIEGIAGIKPYVDAKALKDTLNNWATKKRYNPKDILISKATVTFPFEIPQDLDMTTYPSILFPAYRTDSLQRFYYPFKDIDVLGNSTGSINRSLCEYAMDIPSTIQKLINFEEDKDKKLSKEFNFWLSPIRVESDETYGTTTYLVDTYNYYKGKINGPKAKRYPKLTLVYTVLNKE